MTASKILKSGQYRVKETKPHVIDDDARLKIIHVRESDVLRCCSSVKVGGYVEVRSLVLPKGTIVKRVRHDPDYRAFSFMIWNMEFPVVPDDRYPPRFDEDIEFMVHLYKIADQ